MINFNTFLTVFVSVFVAELGDKTQIATFFFASTKTGAGLSVFLGSAAALVCSSGLAVAGGSLVGRYVNPAVLNGAAGMGFIIIGLMILINRG